VCQSTAVEADFLEIERTRESRDAHEPLRSDNIFDQERSIGIWWRYHTAKCASRREHIQANLVKGRGRGVVGRNQASAEIETRHQRGYDFEIFIGNFYRRQRESTGIGEHKLIRAGRQMSH